jgi:hypothetical protein
MRSVLQRIGYAHVVSGCIVHNVHKPIKLLAKKRAFDYKFKEAVITS